MPRFYYGNDGQGKLVRDHLDQIISSKGHKVKSHRLSPLQLSEEILKKIPEELDELTTSLKNGNQAEEKTELADLLTLLGSYIKVRKFSKTEITKIKNAKTAKMGAFEQGLVIEYNELNPDSDDYDFWLSHFRNNSDRYIEKY